jgi:hypothetical protein
MLPDKRVSKEALQEPSLDETSKDDQADVRVDTEEMDMIAPEKDTTKQNKETKFAD